MEKTSDLIAQRHQTHGDFATNSIISQALKGIIHSADTERSVGVPPVAMEALDQIALKMSRILSGHHAHPDHWDDIAGYALLAKQFFTPKGNDVIRPL